MKLIFICLLSCYISMTLDLLDKFDEILGEDNLTESIKSMLLNKDESNTLNLDNLLTNFKEYTIINTELRVNLMFNILNQ